MFFAFSRLDSIFSSLLFYVQSPIKVLHAVTEFPKGK